MNSPGLPTTSAVGAPPVELPTKFERLKELIDILERPLVAYSGGVDSTLVAKVAIDVLGPDNVLAAIAISPSLGAEEEQAALRVLDEIGIAHIRVPTGEVNDPRYAANPINR